MATRLADGIPETQRYAAEWAHEALGPDRVDWLRRLPAERRLWCEDTLVLLTHASPGSQTAGFDQSLDPTVVTERLAKTDARVVCCGHTHLPEVRDLGWKVIVNDGSAGYVFDGEPTPYAREHLHRPERTEPWIWMAWTVGVLAVLAVIGGWVQIAGVWHPFANFLEPPVEPLIEPSGTQDLVASIFAVGLGVAGIAVAWAAYSARTLRIPSAPAVRALLEHKFYFDELYDWVFYRPSVALALALRDWIERPVLLGSIDSIATGARRLGNDLSELQTGLVRTYALAIAGSVTVLALVFVWVR